MSQTLNESKQAADQIATLVLDSDEQIRKLASKLRTKNPKFICSVARGSSDNAATYGAYLFPQMTGRLVASIPPSVVTVLNSQLQSADAFVFAVSQSGSSPDLNMTIQNCRKHGALTASIVNNKDSDLAKNAEFVIDQKAGPEVAVAATKTVLCSMTAIAMIATYWMQDKKMLQAFLAFPQTLFLASEIGSKCKVDFFDGVKNVYVLSRALGFSVACELALKIKETCGIHAEAFSTAEVRHGPKEIVDAGFLIIGLALPGSGKSDVIQACKELQNQGAKVFLVSDEQADLCLPNFIDERLYPIICLQALYPWLIHASIALGRNPDCPKELKSKVVHTL